MHRSSHPISPLSTRLPAQSLSGLVCRDIDRGLRQALIAGAAFSAMLPFAHAQSVRFGWLPLWLVGLPLAAWLGWRALSWWEAARLDRLATAVRRGSLPSPTPMAMAMTGARPRRRVRGVQARRRRLSTVAAMAPRHLRLP